MNQFSGAWTVIAVITLSLTACTGGENSPDRSGPELVQGRPAADASDSTLRRRRTLPASDSVGVQPLVRRQVLYVPAYAHIFFQDQKRTINLATTLSIHNIDPEHALRLTAVEYYNSSGELVRRHLEEPKTLGPFASTWYVIEESDLSGGVGANFIVEWESDEPVNPPAVETVMISAAQTQGISFTSQARVLEQER